MQAPKEGQLQKSPSRNLHGPQERQTYKPKPNPAEGMLYTPIIPPSPASRTVLQIDPSPNAYLENVPRELQIS